MRRCTWISSIIAFIILGGPCARGAVKSWTGGGGNGNWGTAGNWAPFGVPNSGDHLIFPGATPFLNNTNNLPWGFGSITFNGASGGYNLRGNPITLTDGVIATHTAGANTIEMAITLERAQIFNTASAGTLTISGNIALNGNSMTVDTSTGTITLSGVISGFTAFITALTKRGTGTLILSGPSPNTYTGELDVNAGTLQLSKTVGPAVTQNINVLSTVTLTSSNQIGNSSVITLDTATLNLNNQSDTIGELTMLGSTINTGTGVLTLGSIGGVTVNPSAVSSVINGNFDLGFSTRPFDVFPGTAADGLIVNANIAGGFALDEFGGLVFAGISKYGEGRMVLRGTNTFAGLVRISEGILVAESAGAFGTTNGGVEVFYHGSLGLNGAHIGNEPLIINVTNVSVWGSLVSSWSGPVTLNSNAIFNSSGALTFSNVISGPGALRLEGATFDFAGTQPNTYAGLTVSVANLLRLSKTAAIPTYGDLEIGDLVSADNSHIVRVLGPGPFGPTLTDVLINCSGLLDLNNHVANIYSLTLQGGSVENVGQNLTLYDGINVKTGGSGCARSRIAASQPWQFVNTTAGTWDIRFPSESLTQFSPELEMDVNIGNTANIVVSGNSGHLYLMASNEFSGTFSVSSTSDPGVAVHLLNDYALGTTTAGTMVSGRAKLVLEGGRTIREPLTICGFGPGSNGVIEVSGTNTWQTNVVLSCDVLMNCLTGSVFAIEGVVSGPGNLRKIGPGTLTLAGSQPNTYTGNTFVFEGNLNLAKTASADAIANGTLTIGDDLGGLSVDVVRHMGGNQINNTVPITIFGSGLLDLNGFSDEVGPLTLIGGDVATGTGTLTLGADVTSLASSNSASGFSGRLQLLATRAFNVTNGTLSPDVRINASVSGPGGLIKNGRGELSLNASNTYAGVTTLNAGILDVDDSFALGATGSGTVVNAGASLVLRGDVHVPAEPLTLNGNGFSSTVGALDGRPGSNSWAGAITINSDSIIHVNAVSDILNLSGSIGGADITKTGAGTLIFSGFTPNSFGDMRMNAGTLVLAKSIVNAAILHDLYVGDDIGGVGVDVVRILNNAQIDNTNGAVHVARSGLLELDAPSEIISLLDGSGQIDLGSGELQVDIPDGSSTYRGVISGPGSFSKSGVGTLVLAGNNTYTGVTAVLQGILTVNGFQPQSPVAVNSATLSGAGTVGDITATGGWIAPDSILTASNIAFRVGGRFLVDLNRSNNDQLIVRGTNDLGSTTLQLTIGPDFAPVEGQRFTIIENDGTEPVVGTFAGLPNGSLLTRGGIQFRIVYDNDVALLVTNTPLRLFAAALSSGNRNGVIDPNECNLLNVTLNNISGSMVTGVAATLIPQTAGVAVTLPFSPYPDVPAAGRRTNAIPFQLSTLPGFLCGTNVEFALVIQTAANGRFTIPISLPSGSPGTPTRFDNNTAFPIPDLGTVASGMAVSGITTPIKRVSVSLHITHSAVADLDITLAAPDGTTINLSSDNGGTFSDYGTDCSDSGRTVFVDTAATNIVLASAPFVGSFRPEQALSAFNEKFGSAVNGVWTLRITDDSAGGLGTLRCWSLFISGSACTDGGGACESCPERTILGSISERSAVQNGRLVYDGNVSSCLNVKACPGTAVVGARSFDAYSFVNGESSACIEVSLSAPCELFSVAYRGGYDPAEVCHDYLGDLGFGVFGTTNTYSFAVGARERFVVVVNQIDPTAFCDYQLSVTGGSCQPILDIVPLIASRVLLDWSTAAVGYELERADSLADPLWLRVVNIPTIDNGRFTLSQPIPGTNRFYRLRKP